MSEENVEVVLRQFELWNAGSFKKAMGDYDPDVVVGAPRTGPKVR